MKNLTPQEKLDLIDLLIYAYKKKYIKRFCRMSLDDPVRKVTQRILSKMFPGACVGKNRNRDAYNISFTGKPYFGDYRIYVGYEDQVVDPRSIIDISKAVNGFSHIPPNAWYHALAVVFNPCEYETDSYWIRRGERQAVKEEHIAQAKEMVENDPNYAMFHDEKLDGFTDDVMCMEELMLYNNPEASSMISYQDYGFRLDYSCQMFGTNLLREFHKNVTPVGRRFRPNGPVIRILEGYTEAYKIYRRIKHIWARHWKIFKRMESFNRCLTALAYDKARSEQRDEIETYLRRNSDVYALLSDDNTRDYGYWALDRMLGTSLHSGDNEVAQPTSEPQTSNEVEIAGRRYNRDELQRRFMENLVQVREEDGRNT